DRRLDRRQPATWCWPPEKPLDQRCSEQSLADRRELRTGHTSGLAKFFCSFCSPLGWPVFSTKAHRPAILRCAVVPICGLGLLRNFTRNRYRRFSGCVNAGVVLDRRPLFYLLG